MSNEFKFYRKGDFQSNTKNYSQFIPRKVYLFYTGVIKNDVLRIFCMFFVCFLLFFKIVRFL